MGEVPRNELQQPAPEIRAPLPKRGIEVMEERLAAGREWARKATQRSLDWIEGHPGQALLIAVAFGFVIGQIAFRPRRPVDEEVED